MPHPPSTRRLPSDEGDAQGADGGAPLGTPDEDLRGAAVRDATWMRRVATGDREAFRALYEHHAPRLLRFLWRLCGDRQAAEDWLQETFLKVWDAAGRFDPERPLGPWLYSIARRHAWQRLARRSRRKAVWRQLGDGRADRAAAQASLPGSAPSASHRPSTSRDTSAPDAGPTGQPRGAPAPAAEAPSVHDSAGRRLEQEELARHLAAALARLSPRLRLAFVLVRMEQQSLGAAAEIAGVPVGTVKSRLVAAERRLRRLLGPHLN